MSTELKRAAQMALDALTEMIVAGKSNTWTAQQAVHDLRTALQSAQASEPVAALVRYRRIRTPAHCAFDKKDHYSEWSDWVPCTLSYAKAVTDPARDVGLLPLYEMLPLYSHPAPGVPDDSKRLNYLQDRGATIDLIPGVADFYPMRFRVGGLHSSASIDVRAAIDAAMLAARERP